MDFPVILQQRNRQSFDWLYDKYAASLLSVILRIVGEGAVAERILLETYVAAWASLDEPEVKSQCIFVWMVQIARAKAAEHLSHAAESHDTITNNNTIWTPSLQKRTEGSGTLTGGEKQAT